MEPRIERCDAEQDYGRLIKDCIRVSTVVNKNIGALSSFSITDFISVTGTWQY